MIHTAGIVEVPPPRQAGTADDSTILSPDRGTVGNGSECALLRTRRAFLQKSGMVIAAAALLPLLDRWTPPAQAAVIDITTDTINGLVAFIVPGPDDYSVHQGVHTPEPGGIQAFATPGLMFALDLLQLAPPGLTFSQFVAIILNNVAQGVYFQIHGVPAPAGPFPSAFANLSFGDKIACFAAMESGLIDPALVPLAGALPFLVAFTAYSEVGVFNPATRTLIGQPVGWALSGYDGVANGRDDFLGYYENRKKVS
jgi:hypothetical protein